MIVKLITIKSQNFFLKIEKKIYLVLNIKSMSILTSCHMNEVANMLTLAYLPRMFESIVPIMFTFVLK